MDLIKNKVSIIVPIYNLASYLHRCIDSLLQQTYSNLQIILIDDGSTDNSVNILKTYAKQDERILLLCQENAGVSVARNRALKRATGEFIMFVDGDDWLDKETVRSMLNVIQQNNLDVVCCGFVFEDSIHAQRRISTIRQEILILKNDLILNHYLQGKGIASSVWARLYRKSFLEVSNFTFNSNLRIGEDGFFSLQVMLKAKSIAIIKPVFYHILVRSGSATRTAKIEYKPNGLPTLYESYLKENSCWESFENSYKAWYVRAISSDLLRSALKLSYDDYKYYYKKSVGDNFHFFEYNTFFIRFMMDVRKHICALICKSCFTSYYVMRLFSLCYKERFPV